MPAHLIAIPQDNSIALQFTDAEGQTVGEPQGASLAWTVENDKVVTVVPDATNPLRATVQIAGPQGGQTEVGVSITGVNDVDGQPYSVLRLQVTAYPPTPARMIFGPDPAQGQ